MARGRPERRRATSRRTGSHRRAGPGAPCPSLCFARARSDRPRPPPVGRSPRPAGTIGAAQGDKLASRRLGGDSRAPADAGLGLPRGRAMLPPLLLKSGTLDVAAGLATKQEPRRSRLTQILALGCGRKAPLMSPLDARFATKAVVAGWPPHGHARAAQRLQRVPTFCARVPCPGATARDREPAALGDQSGYSSLRQARGSSDSAFGVRSRRNEWYGATNGSGAITV